jgi:hypothetical protein
MVLVPFLVYTLENEEAAGRVVQPARQNLLVFRSIVPALQGGGVREFDDDNRLGLRSTFNQLGGATPNEEASAILGDSGSEVYAVAACTRVLETGETKLHALVADLFICTILGRQPLCGKPIQDEQARVAAAIFFAKTRLGWQETDVHQHEGHNGGPIVFQAYPEDNDL